MFFQIDPPTRSEVPRNTAAPADGANISVVSVHSSRRGRKYINRENSTIIEAIRYDGSNKSEIENFVGCKLDYYISEFKVYSIAPPRHYLLIPCFFTHTYADIGDYIYKDIKNNFQVCNPDIFEKNFELITE